MTKELNKAEFWNSASLAGLCIGAVPIAHSLITKTLIGIDNIIVITLLTMVLWIVKFIAGIYLTKFFMDRYRIKTGNGGYQILFRFGIASGFCAALIYSGFTLADFLIISPEFYEEAFNQTMATTSQLFDSNTIAAMEKSMPQIPAITFFSNLIYCSLYGMLLATILAKYIAAKHFFDKVYNGTPLNFTKDMDSNVDEQENIQENHDSEDDKSDKTEL